MFSEAFKHVAGENVFLQFIAVKIPWQSFHKNKLKKKQQREKGEEKVILINFDHPQINIITFVSRK